MCFTRAVTSSCCLLHLERSAAACHHGNLIIGFLSPSEDLPIYTVSQKKQVCKFQVKVINFNGMSKSSAAISDFSIMQDSVATQLR